MVVPHPVDTDVSLKHGFANTVIGDSVTNLQLTKSKTSFKFPKVLLIITANLNTPRELNHVLLIHNYVLTSFIPLLGFFLGSRQHYSQKFVCFGVFRLQRCSPCLYSVRRTGARWARLLGGC